MLRGNSYIRLTGMMVLQLTLATGLVCGCNKQNPDKKPDTNPDKYEGQKVELFRFRENRKTGYIDRNGKVVIPARFDAAYGFSDGLSMVQIGKKFGFVDAKGNHPFPANFKWVQGFHHGRARARTADGKDGFINLHGKMVFTLGGNVRCYRFSEGLAFVGYPVDPDKPYHNRPRKCGYLDTSGELVIEAKFDETYDFHNGYATVRVGEKYGMIDKSGAFVIEPKFDKMATYRAWSDGLIPVRVGSRQWGAADLQGKVVIAPNFTGMEPFSEGLAAARIRNDKGERIWGYIDTTGKWIIQPQFSIARRFQQGRAIVVVKGQQKYVGVIDKTGRYVMKVPYEKALVVGTAYSNGVGAFLADGKRYIVDLDGKYVCYPAK